MSPGVRARKKLKSRKTGGLMEETEILSCLTCAFFRQYASEDNGYCCRYPPKVLYDSDRDSYESVFPTVAQDDFCGEYQEDE